MYINEIIFPELGSCMRLISTVYWIAKAIN